MCGRETLTIEVSSTSKVAPSMTARATNHLCDADLSSATAAGGMLAVPVEGSEAIRGLSCGEEAAPPRIQRTFGESRKDELNVGTRAASRAIVNEVIDGYQSCILYWYKS